MTEPARRAVVTGSDSGIGCASALALAEEGVDVGVTWHTDREGAERTGEAVRARGARAVVARLDTSRADEAINSIRGLAEELGGLEILVNNAAVNRRAPFLEESLAAWRHTLDVNLAGPFTCAQAAARLMIANSVEQGRIINVTSVHEHVPLRGGAAYCASKAGLSLLTKVMALELAPHGITVNSVAPGHTATPMNGYDTHDPDTPPRREIPLARVGHPREVASVIAYLASANAAYVTGESVTVDGGLLLTGLVALQDAVEPRSASVMEPNHEACSAVARQGGRPRDARRSS
jgi:NAD(P)-dependent dehydrogenase (short-subunit alcohol dehydrogenase family)